MSIDFIKKGYNSDGLAKAARQQRQINHLTISKVQEDITTEYLKEWADRKYITDDYLLNFVKTIFKTENFLSFYKYLRYPLSSSTLVNETIVPEMERMFYAEDSYFEYYVKGERKKQVEELDSNEFYQSVFQWLMFRHNDIIITQPGDDQNKIVRYPVEINKVVSINCHNNKIKQIAFNGFMDIEGEGNDIEGVIYIDDEKYCFYKNGSEIPSIELDHDLGECPAVFVSPLPFDESKDKDHVVRYSIFSKVREKFEEFVFLKTLQRMVEPNGAIPIVAMLETTNGDDTDNNNADGDMLPMSSRVVGGQRADLNKEVLGEGSPFQAGTIIEVPKILKDDGSLDMNAVQNLIKTYYLPVESLNYLSTRIKEIEQSILRIVIGDYQEANEGAKNEMQVSKSYVSKQDKLRRMASMMSKTVSSCERVALGLIYGKDQTDISIFFGSDFFIETKQDIYELIKQSPNPIETKNLLIRLSSINNRFNKSRQVREKILYLLLPYANNNDFIVANEKDLVQRDVFELQTRFTYWIGMFEANYGNIKAFWDGMGEAQESEKLITINNLMFNLIQNSYAAEV
jgi:hypothetical protein